MSTTTNPANTTEGGAPRMTPLEKYFVVLIIVHPKIQIGIFR